MKQKPDGLVGEAKMVKAKLNAPSPLGPLPHCGHRRGFVGIYLCVSLLGLLSAAGLLGGYQSLAAAFLAFNICALAVIANRALTLFVFKNRLAPAYCTLSGMLLRMALPLSLCCALAWWQSPLLKAGFGYFLIASYLIVLTIDVSKIVLTLKMKPVT